MTETADVERVIYLRSLWGRGFNNANLESKRRSAILWLRNCSKRGWCIDKIINKKGTE